MKAVVISHHVGGHTLMLDDVPPPSLGDNQVRVAVHAVSVNYADLLVPTGGYGKAPADGLPLIAGLDAAGEVVEIGDKVTGVSVGDRVMAMTSSSLAEQVVVDFTHTAPIPDGWSYAEGAAAIVGLLTEQDALTAAANIRAGEHLVVTGATSGMGMQCIQLGSHLRAQTIIAVARSPRADDILRQLGATHIIHSDGDRFADSVRDFTSGHGGDVSIDHVGGKYFESLVDAAAIGGRIVNVGRAAGSESVVDLEAFSLKRITLRGVTFRSRTHDEIAVMYQHVRALDTTNLRPVIDRVLPWSRAQEAQGLLTTGQIIGKVVIDTTAPF